MEITKWQLIFVWNENNELSKPPLIVWIRDMIFWILKKCYTKSNWHENFMRYTRSGKINISIYVTMSFFINNSNIFLSFSFNNFFSYLYITWTWIPSHDKRVMFFIKSQGPELILHLDLIFYGTSIFSLNTLYGIHT